MSRKRESPYTTRITIALPPALDAALRAGSDKYDVAVAGLARGAIERGVKLELDARRKQARHKPRQSARQPAPRPNPSATPTSGRPPLTLADIAHIKDDGLFFKFVDFFKWVDTIAAENVKAGLRPTPAEDED